MAGPSTSSQLCSRSATTVDVVLLEELPQALLARLADARLRRRRIDVVRVDLERHQVERGETRRLHDRHVVGRPDGRARDVGARAGTEVRDAAFDCRAHGRDQAQPVECAHEPEAVATRHEDRLQLFAIAATGSPTLCKPVISTPTAGEPLAESSGGTDRGRSARTGSSPRAGPRGDDRRSPVARRGAVTAGVKHQTSVHGAGVSPGVDVVGRRSHRG